MQNPPVAEKLWDFLTYHKGNKGIYTFFKGINLKGKIISGIGVRTHLLRGCSLAR